MLHFFKNEVCMRKLFMIFALMLGLTTTVEAQYTNLTGGYEFAGTSGDSYEVTYLGSGGASYWHSLWAVDASNLNTRTLLFCKVADCVSNSFYGVAQTPYVYSSPSQWVFGLYVETSGTADVTPDASGYWLYSLAALNGGNSFLRDFGTANGVRQDDRTTIVPGTVSPLSGTVLGFEDIRTNGVAGGDRDFNDAIFTLEKLDSGTPQEVVPEPATMTLLATGLVGLAGARRKRNK